MKTKIYYSVQNCGDGSAYPTFMETEALADWDQEHQYEGWGENCSGHIEIEHMGPIFYSQTTVQDYYLDLFDSEETEEIEEFIDKFYNGIAPRVTVEIKDARKYNILIDDAIVRQAYGEYIRDEGWRTSETHRAIVEEIYNP
jgi:hypothetical protein